MALTKVSRSLLNTGVADASDATAISIDSSENVTLAGDLDLADSKKIKLGGSDDLQIYHDGSNSFINEGGTGGLKILSGDVYIRNPSDEDMIHATSGGAVRLYYDNASRLYTHTSGVKLDEHLYLVDSKKIFLGTGDDLSIYHDGSNSYIEDSGTGDLYLSAADNFIVRKYGGSEVMIKGTADGAAELYYDDSKKLETVTGGVTVTGTLTATSLAGNVTTAAQTGITSLLATDIKIGEDDQTKIDFETADEIHFYAANAHQVKLIDGAIVPVTDNDIDLGTSSLEFKDAYFDGTVTSDAFAGPLTGDVTGNVSGTAATVTTAAQTNITSLGTLTTLTVDNVIVNGTTIGHTSDTDLMTLADGVLTVAGEVDATSLDISGDVDIDGTLETDNLTVGGAQGSDGQVLTSTGSGVGWESVSAGTTTLDGLSEAKHGGGSGDFAGSILISHDGTTGTLDNALYNTGYGYEVFDKITSGDSNTAIGFQAAYDLTSSSNNTLVGRLAGSNVSTGGNHTLIGYSAGDNISDSVHNTAVGYEAQGASNGNYNTAIGDRALHATNGGDENTVVGSRAHYGTANSATRNTVVGVSAMEGATTGSYNSALGVRALYLNSSGTENVAAGYLCMDANTTGSYNVAYGTNALGGNETGANNVAIGHESLMAYTGGDNVAIGYRAGKAATQSRCTYIGYDAGTAQNGSADNMAIGYMALSRQTTGANGNIAIGNYTGRAVVDSASTSQLLAIGHNVANNASAALAGYQNVFIGYNVANTSALAGAFQNTALGGSCLSALSTGDQNVCIGNKAGDAITTGSNNVLVGYDAGSDALTTISTTSNNIIIGNVSSAVAEVKIDWTVGSDQRDKTDIETLPSNAGLNFVNQMRPVTYVWDNRSWYLPRDEDGIVTDTDITKVTPDGSKKSTTKQVGFIAQEIKAIEEAIGWTDDHVVNTSNPQSYKLMHSQLIPILVKALQEADDKIDALETRIKTLEDA